MSIRRGQPWGRTVAAAPEAPIVDGDAALADLVSAARPGADGLGPLGPFVVTGGDLHRTLGSPQREDPRSGELLEFSCDVVTGEATGDDGGPMSFLAVAHVLGLPVGRRRGPAALWRGPTFVAANAAFLDDANIGPRAHPGDGLIDVSAGAMEPRDRRAARRRILTGTHLPHPGLTEHRTREWASDPGNSYVLVCDGRELGVARDVRLIVETDAVLVRV